MYHAIHKSVFILLAFVTTIVHSQSKLEIEEAVREIQERHNVPAVGFVLVRNGRLVTKKVMGIRDIETNEVANEHSIFRLGSISKAFAGLAALKAQELGLFTLNDKVSDHLGSSFINNPWEAQSPIRIKHLLEHTAGFFDITQAEFDHESDIPITLEEAFSISPESRTVHWKPGIQSSYSNIGAPIVALIIQTVSGMTYEAFMDSYVLGPLNMSSSTFFNDEYTSQHIASGHSRGGRRVIPY
jgi:CubicO group peptidase (beta-lactamase class C family)